MRSSFVGVLLGTLLECAAYLLPYPDYVFSRGMELRASTKPTDLLADGGAALTDTRLAGWRVKKGQPEDADRKETAERNARMLDPSCLVQGDVVEYPLSADRKLPDDHRVKGLGVLVHMNTQRLDAKLLPAHLLDMCTIFVLTVDPITSQDQNIIYQRDELEPAAFISREQLKKVKATCNMKDDKWRRWEIQEELSAGCGPSPGPEEEPTIL